MPQALIICTYIGLDGSTMASSFKESNSQRWLLTSRHGFTRGHWPGIAHDKSHAIKNHSTSCHFLNLSHIWPFFRLKPTSFFRSKPPEWLLTPPKNMWNSGRSPWKRGKLRDVESNFSFISWWFLGRAATLRSRKHVLRYAIWLSMYISNRNLVAFHELLLKISKIYPNNPEIQYNHSPFPNRHDEDQETQVFIRWKTPKAALQWPAVTKPSTKASKISTGSVALDLWIKVWMEVGLVNVAKYATELMMWF